MHSLWARVEPDEGDRDGEFITKSEFREDGADVLIGSYPASRGVNVALSRPN